MSGVLLLRSALTFTLTAGLVACLGRHRRRGGSSGDVQSRVSPEEWALRCRLAAAYRLAASCGWNEVIYNHITARVPGSSDHFLINPFGLKFDEVTASSLIKVDLNGTVIEPGSTDLPFNLAGYVVHSAVHGKRPDLECIFHNHYTPCVAVSACKAGFLPVSQEACILMPRIAPAMHPFEGVATDPLEKAAIVSALGDKQVLFMENHGVLCAGRTVAEAFWNTFMLCRACDHQIAAMSAVGSNRPQRALYYASDDQPHSPVICKNDPTGGRIDELTLPPASVVEQTAARVQKAFEAHGNLDWGKWEFDALVRDLGPSYLE